MTDNYSQCAKCGLPRRERLCQKAVDGKGPDFCPTRSGAAVTAAARKIYANPSWREFARQSVIQEGSGYAARDSRPYPVKTRLQEISEFAARMGYQKLGLAFCISLQQEAAQLSQVLENKGFTIVSVVCKVGCIPKEDMGVADGEKIRIGSFEPTCNPVGQAETLNRAGTEFNIALGLCVGHDSLFFKHSQAPVTVFAVKDRVTGHNPLAALYTLHSYYRRLLK
ncbi:MAG: DUF1847 domain-containing protein [bacterium]